MGNYLGCMGTFFHPECFRCHSCGYAITEHEVYIFIHTHTHLYNNTFIICVNILLKWLSLCVLSSLLIQVLSVRNKTISQALFQRAYASQMWSLPPFCKQLYNHLFRFLRISHITYLTNFIYIHRSQLMMLAWSSTDAIRFGTKSIARHTNMIRPLVVVAASVWR